MALCGVTSATIVDVVLGARLCLFGFAFSSDGLSAMATPHEFAAVREGMAVVILVTQQNLHAVPCCPVDDWPVLARIPLPFVVNLADVGPVTKKGVNVNVPRGD